VSVRAIIRVGVRVRTHVGAARVHNELRGTSAALTNVTGALLDHSEEVHAETLRMVGRFTVRGRGFVVECSDWAPGAAIVRGCIIARAQSRQGYAESHNLMQRAETGVERGAAAMLLADPSPLDQVAGLRTCMCLSRRTHASSAAVLHDLDETCAVDQAKDRIVGVAVAERAAAARMDSRLAAAVAEMEGDDRSFAAELAKERKFVRGGEGALEGEKSIGRFGVDGGHVGAGFVCRDMDEEFIDKLSQIYSKHGVSMPASVPAATGLVRMTSPFRASDYSTPPSGGDADL